MCLGVYHHPKRDQLPYQLMTELWLPCLERDDYQVSNLGRVKSRFKILKLTMDRGYLSVHVGRHRLVHQLVAEVWLGPRPEGMVVCHGPNGATDNSVENLSYKTQKENIADKHRDGTRQIGTRNPVSKLTEEQVREIRAIGSSMKQRDLAATYGVSQRAVWQILHRLTWAHLE